MEHNLEDSLKLDSDMGEMDFENPGDVVNQSDITLETGHEGDMQMEFENIQEQQMLMDTGNEEIIGYMGDQFQLQEYSIQDDQSHDVGAMVDANQYDVMTSQSDNMIDLQFEQQNIVASSRQDIIQQPKYISVKAAIPPMRVKKPEATPLASVPRQVAIAPKPPKLVHVPPTKPLPGKHYAIAPKPVSLIANRTPNFKKVTLAGSLQGNIKNTTVLGQLGKQLVMVPSGSGQKIKLVAANTGMPSIQYVRSSSDQTQLVATTSKAISGTQPSKPIKVVVQGQQNIDLNNQPAMITKLLPSSGAGAVAGAPRYVMQQKTVPITIGGNKLILTSPTKQGIKLTKKQQIIAIKSPTPKVMPATSQGTTTKKVVITANPNHNVILKTTAPPKTAQLNKDGNIVVHGQRSQLHQINVPGKGIQYIRLITNPTSSVAKPVVKQQSTALAIPKNFVLTDTKGNVIQMTAEKMVQPPPLVRNDAPNKLAPQKKLVRIAPMSTKVTQASTQPGRSSQSLLAPLSPMAETSASLDNVSELLNHPLMANIEDDLDGQRYDVNPREIEIDTKDHLRTLVENTLTEEPEEMGNYQEVEVEYERPKSTIDEEDPISPELNDSNSMQHPLIVIPPNYMKTQNQTLQDTTGNTLDDSKDLSSMIDVEGDIMRPYNMSPQASQSLSETDYVSNELDLRPRKACNCTKSQCLKLYCDCFANGEFCNRCNCNNCHNNLENEELRQKAIRACLDRNPNAFRPKIGKAKSGGPEIVRRHNKGCNCKRSGCLKNYCECYEAKIACTATCKCVGCRNVEETLQRLRLPRVRDPRIARDPRAVFRPPPLNEFKQPCSFMTSEVIEAVCQCLVAAAAGDTADAEPDHVGDVLDEFARCLQDIISASYQAIPLTLMDQGQA